MRHGPLPRRALPPLRQPGWTLLVQGVDLHVDAAHEMLRPFRFVPDARLDDLMVSYASDGGGVGPHVDSYDVFLLQLQGRRRWRIGRVADDKLRRGRAAEDAAPVSSPSHEWLLEPGDMLYLPPRWGHDGVAVGACMTASVGFRAPLADELARALMLGTADEAVETSEQRSAVRRSRGSRPRQHPGCVPVAHAGVCARAPGSALPRDPKALERALGRVAQRAEAAACGSSPAGARRHWVAARSNWIAARACCTTPVTCTSTASRCARRARRTMPAPPGRRARAAAQRSAPLEQGGT